MEVSARIPQKLFFRIGEVCDLIKVQPHVLRYWESEFPMLAPQKNRAGQRVYRRRDVEMVMRIRDLLYEQKFTIAGAKKKLTDEIRSTPSRPSKRAIQAEPVAQEVTAIQEDLELRPPEVQLTSDSEGDRSQPEQAASLSPKARRAVRSIKRELEALLTLLNSDASIQR